MQISALQLWHLLFEGLERHDGSGSLYISVMIGRRVQGQSAKLASVGETFWTYPEEVDRAWQLAVSADADGREVYFCAHLLTKRRRRRENAADILALYADGDGARVPSDFPTPTATVESSPGRHHYYWRLTHPVLPETAYDLNRRLAVAIGADPSGADLTQLLRVPGTHNRKYGGGIPVELIGISDTSVDPDQLDQMLPRLASVAAPPILSAGRAVDGKPTLSVLVRGQPPVPLNGTARERWEGNRVELGADGEVDRSESLLLIGQVLAEAGATPDQIMDALSDRDASLGWDKYRNRTNSMETYGRIAQSVTQRTTGSRRTTDKTNRPLC